MHYPTERIIHSSCGVLAGTRNSSLDPLWGFDSMIHRTMSGRSTMELHLTPKKKKKKKKEGREEGGVIYWFSIVICWYSLSSQIYRCVDNDNYK